MRQATATWKSIIIAVISSLHVTKSTSATVMAARIVGLMSQSGVRAICRGPPPPVYAHAGPLRRDCASIQRIYYLLLIVILKHSEDAEGRTDPGGLFGKGVGKKFNLHGMGAQCSAIEH